MATGDIYMYGEFGKEITTQGIRSQLDPKYSDYICHTSTVGGDVFVGFEIYNILKNFRATTGKKIVAHIEGLCASIGTLAVAGCDEVIMNRTTQFMIHNPQISGMSGDANQLRNAADQLDKIKTLLIDVYHRKTKLPTDKLWDMYAKESWLTADEARNMGFVDDVQDAIKAVAKADIKFLNTENTMDKAEAKTIVEKIEVGFKNIFKSLRAMGGFKNQMELTLEDGTPIIVMANPEEDPTGKQIIKADGSPLEAGEYTIATGEKVTVGADGLITVWAEGEIEDKDKPDPNKKPEEEKPTEEEMKALDEANKTIESLKAQLAQKETEATAKAAEVTNLSTQFTNLKKEMDEVKKKTFGDDTPPLDAPGKQFMNQGDNFDPMGEDVLKELRARGIR